MTTNNNNNTRPFLNISMVSETAVDHRTTHTRYTHPNTCGFYPTTQAWSWDGGDALVSLVGPDGYTTLRLGDKVHSIRGSVSQALAAFGFTSRVVCPDYEG